MVRLKRTADGYAWRSYVVRRFGRGWTIEVEGGAKGFGSLADVRRWLAWREGLTKAEII